MEESKEEIKPKLKRRTFFTRKTLKGVCLGFIALVFGYIHYRYVSTLFENDTHFSHLSVLEREMSFRTERGFYYSYYKTLAEDKPFVAGITNLMYDRLVEHPKEVNAFNRFNIHPEVLIGGIYRYLEPYLNTTKHRQCHLVNRGEGLTPVESCVGLGEPIIFYLEAIWWLAGFTVAVMFLYATALSRSVIGGIVTVVHYFANHSHCTRVMWAPNERENWALPLLLLQCWLLTAQLSRSRPVTATLQVSIFVLNCMCLLFWQFTQFIFLTQTAIFFLMEQFRIIDIKSLCIFLHSHFCGLHTAVLLLQGNDMLKSSLYASFFLVVSAYCLFFSTLRIKVENRFDLLVESWLVVLRISIVTCTSFYLKKLIGDFLQVEEDSHIWDILYSKFTENKTFHSLLYTCSEVFDFLPWSTFSDLLKSFLLPFTFLGFIVAYYRPVKDAFVACQKETEQKQPILEREGDESDSGIENSDVRMERKDLDLIDKDVKSKIECKDRLVLFLRHLKVDPAVFYNAAQLMTYGVMAVLVMRLKLLFVTQLCICSSLLINMEYYRIPKPYRKFIPLVWLIASAPLVRALLENMAQEMSHVGEFSDLPQEQLIEWIKNETATTSAFAGSMPVLATVLLAARRPVVAHPHYEHKEARDRAYAVYKVYGRFTPFEVYQELSKLKVTYLIVETMYCYGKSSQGCSFKEIWDIENPNLTSKVTACHTLLTETVDHFYPVFRNQMYAVFNVHDYSVRYMPRSFDT